MPSENEDVILPGQDLGSSGTAISAAFLSHSFIVRDEWILKHCAGKRVLHLGCAAFPMTASLGRRGILLHQRLAKVCANLVGVDLNPEALDILRSFGFNNLRMHDVEHLETLQLDEPIDVIVAGEVLEHLNNVGLFFDGCKTLLERYGASLLVTVPSALSLKRMFASILRRREAVHPDHTCYFSPATLSETARRHGMQTVEMRMFMWRNPTLINKMGNAVSRTLIRILRAPLLADGVAAEYFLGARGAGK